jgi:hypothetical protein
VAAGVLADPRNASLAAGTNPAQSIFHPVTSTIGTPAQAFTPNLPGFQPAWKVLEWNHV